jgi:hypothetical protein
MMKRTPKPTAKPPKRIKPGAEPKPPKISASKRKQGAT